ncbi:hypothetical protein C0993_006164 [Termitomyces sp. T159_Od127]|nr:hypothetical protein C0993_008639 [Termitomyces sp. T159_Od127]KAG6883442.1 hypothetical protein C0993_006164 [Termitomyces sp. T159_Od127]
MESSETKHSSSPYKFPATTGFEGQPFELDERRDRISREMAGYFLGPMPVKEFLEHFLPKSELPPPSRPSNHFSTVPINGTEPKMYDPFHLV